MPDRFDEVIAATLKSGAETRHEVMPADFGEPGTRRILFARCLAMLAGRYAGIHIRVSGERAALMEMGLIANGEMLAGMRIFRTQAGLTEQPGAVRLTFTRKLR